MKLPQLIGIELGEPWRIADNKQGIAVPILQIEKSDRNYILLSESKKMFLKDTGEINIAEARNDGDINVFIRKGTMLKGDTQHRAIVYSVVVPPHQVFYPEIRCIYQSKGIRAGAVYSSSGYTPRNVTSTLQHDQGTVWKSVSDYSSNHYETLSGNMPNLSSAFLMTSEISSDDLTGYQEKISDDVIISAMKNVPADVANQIGIVILDAEGVQGFEMFDHPDSWKALSKTIIRNYADILSKPVPEYYTFDLEKIKEHVINFLTELISTSANVVFDLGNVQTFSFNTSQHTGEYTLLDAELIHFMALRQSKRSKKPKISMPLPSPLIWDTPDSTHAPGYWDHTTYAAVPQTLDPTDPMMERIMRYLTKKRGNETFRSLLGTSRSFTEVERNTKMSPTSVSKGLKEGEELGLLKKVYQKESGRTAYQLTELGKKFDIKNFTR